ncbi:MAG: type II secretion system protein N [Burkholderiales bacterium]
MTAYVVAGVLAYAVALVALLPAPWIAHAIERASGQTILLRDPAGTVWSGSGRLFLRQHSGEMLGLGKILWNSSIFDSLAGKLVTDIAISDSAKSMRLELSPASTTVRGLDLALPGQALENVAPGLGALGPQGKVLIRSDSLRFDANSILGLADVEWRPVQLARANGLELGSHVARLRGGGRKVDIELGTIAGPLRLSGGGSWSRDGGLIVTGAIEHGGDPSGSMTQFLQTVCNEYRPGHCAFRIMQRPAKGA